MTSSDYIFPILRQTSYFKLYHNHRLIYIIFREQCISRKLEDTYNLQSILHIPFQSLLYQTLKELYSHYLFSTDIKSQWRFFTRFQHSFLLLLIQLSFCISIYNCHKNSNSCTILPFSVLNIYQQCCHGNHFFLPKKVINIHHTWSLQFITVFI